MPTKPDRPASPSAVMATEASVTSPWRLWILLVWHPALGLPMDPVAVLGLDGRPGAPVQRVVRWVPLVYEPADPWRERLGENSTLEDAERWTTQSGACSAEAVEVPDGALDLTHAADLVLDELLAELIPTLPPRDGA
ncbi:hypothetical protein [Streptomyces graminilatus]|uniref:hypothetical protein n=1 Tax=Streptomyces graminilatus TaxID=1464070 RepID=UPI000AA2E643|nr:hypothetical protein [Streptomyces graminilatus]